MSGEVVCVFLIVGRCRILGVIDNHNMRIAHVELAGDGAGDQAGAVLADQVDLALGAGDELI
jgi:hypothetical protein